MDIRRKMLFKKKASSGGGTTTTGGSYTVNLNGQWETAALHNPDSTLYDGVYRSSSNYHVNNGVATMYITIKECSSFKMYIRSDAESNYDYVMVSQLDRTINGNTSYSDTTLVKAHTRGNQQSGTALSNYTLVEFTGITPGEHTITVVYRKDSSVNSGDDRGYVLIPKSQAGNGDSGSGGGDEGGSNEGQITDNYLTIEALENGLTAKLSTNACEYCIDGDGNWKSLSAGKVTKSINSGHTLSFRGNLKPTLSIGIGSFTISKKCNLKGNCMSMLFGDNAANNYSLSGKNYAFSRLFYDCSNIVNISDNFLPATTLANDCYEFMFQNCTGLTTAPTLPATTLSDYCYEFMFQNCTGLTTAPTLPATTLAAYCYENMFYNCIGLTTTPTLPATTLAAYCYAGMFHGWSSLTTAPELPVTTLANACYASMFEGCTSLTTAPELPATTLASDCYASMFEDCTSLTTAPELPVTDLREYCYHGMFKNCINLTNAPKLPATSLTLYCYASMFQNCTSLTTAPELPATHLYDYCYNSMFEGCNKLNYIKMLATNLSDFSLSDWVNGVASSGTFVKNPAMTTLSTGVDGIPSGWTVINAGDLITFTVDDTEYQAVEGMTWEEFINSPYNNGDFSLNMHGVIIYDDMYILENSNKGYSQAQNKNEVIIINGLYSISLGVDPA